MSDLEFYNKQDKEELVSMCIARDNKINSLKQENKQLKEQKNKLRDYILDQLKEYEKGIEDYKRYGIEDYTNGMAVGFKKCLEVLGADNENSRN